MSDQDVCIYENRSLTFDMTCLFKTKNKKVRTDFIAFQHSLFTTVLLYVVSAPLHASRRPVEISLLTQKLLNMSG